MLAKGLNLAVEFTYRDRFDRVTHRRANVHVIHGDESDNPVAITAHCHLRRAERTFVLARMSNMVDLSIGELVESPMTWAREEMS